MQTPIPPETNRDFDWIAGLSGRGLIVAVVGVTGTLSIWGLHHWPVAARAPLALLTLLVTAALAWLKWPMEDHGVPLTTWAVRIWTYYSQYRAPVKELTGHPTHFGRESGGGRHGT
jgi:hypothetical protein